MPSSSAHKRKKRQGISSCRMSPLVCVPRVLLTLSQTITKFQKPIIHSSAVVSPNQAFASLMATIYML